MSQDFSKFKMLKPGLMASLDKLLSSDISSLVPLLQHQQQQEEEELRGKLLPGVLDGGFLESFRPVRHRRDPFREPGQDEAERGQEWAVQRLKPKYDEIFYNLSPSGGKLSGSKVRQWMLSTLLPSSVLAQVWRLSDVDGDGMLDNEEFALAVHLIEGKLEGYWLPRELPSHLVPPSKRPLSADQQ